MVKYVRKKNMVKYWFDLASAILVEIGAVRKNVARKNYKKPYY